MRERVIVNPGIGIGNIHFGMSREKVEEVLNQCGTEDKTTGEFSISYIYENYNIVYKDNKVVEITIHESIEYILCLNNMNVFETKAEDVIDELKQLSSDYECDCEEEYLSTEFYVQDLGLLLWRESVYHPMFLDEKWFQDFISVNEENLEYEQRFWYFHTMTLRDESTLEPVTIDKTSFNREFTLDSTEKEEKPIILTEEKIRALADKYGLIG